MKDVTIKSIKTPTSFLIFFIALTHAVWGQNSPTNLHATNETATGFTLNWTPPTNTPDGYNVYVNNENDHLAWLPSTATSFNITLNQHANGPFANQSHDYLVIAYQGTTLYQATLAGYTIGNTGPQDTENPQSPGNVASSNVTASSATLSWDLAPDNIGTVSYKIYQTGQASATYTTSGLTYTVQGLSSNSSYTFEIAALDAANNESESNHTVSIQTLGAPANSDYPTSLHASNATATAFALNWTAPTNYTPSGYNICLNSTSNILQWIDNPSTTSYFIDSNVHGGINPGESNTYIVIAYNPNWQAFQSDFVYTLGDPGTPDTENPQPPTSFTASNLTSSSVDLSWSGATDNIEVTGYDLYQAGIQNPIHSLSGTTQQVTGLSADTDYSFTIQAKDAANNVSNAAALTIRTNPGSSQPTIIHPTHPKLAYIGRIDSSDVANQIVKMDWPGTGVRLKFHGSSLKTKINSVPLSTVNKDYVTIVIDGVITNERLTLSPGIAEYTIASGLDANQSHTAEIYKLTDPYDGYLGFTEFTLDAGKSLETYDRPALKIEFYGDSQTTGYGMDDPSSETDSSLPQFQNNYYSYANVTARMLGAEAHVMSQSGIGLFDTPYAKTIGGETIKSMSQVQGRTLYRDQSAWNFSNWKPDLVCINLGQNDKDRGNYLQDDYESMVNYLRNAYSDPNLPVILLLGDMDAVNNTTSVGHLENAKAQLGSDTYSYIFPIGSPTNSIGYILHPTRTRAQSMADQLVNLIQTNNILGGVSDNENPSDPSNLVISNIGTSSATLSWSASTDNVGLAAYDIFANGNTTTPFASVNGTTTSASLNLTEDTQYTFSLQARDFAGNSSQIISASPFTTLPIVSGAWETISDWDGTTPAWAIGSEAVYNPVANPHNDANNGSANVAAVTTNNSQWNLIQHLMPQAADFASNPIYKLKVWTPVAGKILLKIEDENDGNQSVSRELLVNTTNQWQELTFDFTGSASGLYKRLVIFVDFNGQGANTWYLDDLIRSTPTTGSQVVHDVLANWDDVTPTNWVADNYGTLSSSANPLINTENPSAQSGLFVTNGGNADWDGQFSYEPGTAFDFSSKPYFRMKVYTPEARGLIMIKFEGGGTPYYEKGAYVHGRNSGWEDLYFDFSQAPSGVYTKMIVFVDYGDYQKSTINDNWYIDDFERYDIVGDTQAPSKPTGLAASHRGDKYMTVSWNESTDNAKLKHYEVYLDGNLWTESTSNEILLHDLQSSKEYKIEVKAIDVAGNQSGLSGDLKASTTTSQLDAALDGYNYVFGTQTFDPDYTFTDKNSLAETSNGIIAMGSNILKITLQPNSYIPGAPTLKPMDAINNYPELTDAMGRPEFKYIFLWASDPSVWIRDGISSGEAQAESNSMYALTQHLLDQFKGQGKTFFIGGWEQDWELVNRNDIGPSTPEDWNEHLEVVDPVRISGMQQFLNARQAAVENAIADYKANNTTDVNVYHYAEVNLPKSRSLDNNRVSMLSDVLPYVNIDFVSYSCYDAIRYYNDEATIRQNLISVLDTLENSLQPKSGLPFEKRVFIGEFGFPNGREAKGKGYAEPQNQEDQDLWSRYVMKAALDWGSPFALYWTYYGNEHKTVDSKDWNTQNGYWMVDNRNQKQKIYHTYKNYYEAARQGVADFMNANGGSLPTEAQFKTIALNALSGASNASSRSSKKKEITLADEKPNLPLSVYPNPTTDQFFISNHSLSIRSVHLFDLSGNKILTASKFDQGVIRLDVSSLKKGIYLLKTTTSENTISTIKIMKK